MQEQMTAAIGKALTGGMGAPAGAGAAGSPKAGRRFLAAMIKARENGCSCDACRLLRQELDEAIGDLLKTMGEDATGDDSQPAAGATA